MRALDTGRPPVLSSLAIVASAMVDGMDNLKISDTGDALLNASGLVVESRKQLQTTDSHSTITSVPGITRNVKEAS